MTDAKTTKKADTKADKQAAPQPAPDARKYADAPDKPDPSTIAQVEL